MTAPASGSFEAMVKTRNTFYGYVFGCIAIMVVIQLIPKDPSELGLRLILMVLFFTCFASLTWSFSTPYRDYLEGRYRWRYANADPSMVRTMMMYIHRTTRVTAGLAWIGTAFATLLGLWVFSHWDEGAFLVPMRSVLAMGCWGSLVLLPIYAFAMSGTLREAQQLKHTLDEQTMLSDFKVQTDADAKAHEKAKHESPVTVTGPLEFQAGGFDWRWNDFYKNTAIFGQSGSGKTVCVLNALLEGLIGSSTAPNKAASGLILDPKGDFRDKVELLCRKYNRGRDLLIIDPENMSQSIRWNPLDSPDDALEVAGRFAGVLEVLGQKGEKDTFWVDTAKTFVRHMIALLRATKTEPPTFQEIYECATSDVKLSRWCDKITDDSPKSGKQAIDYFIYNWETLADDTKSVVRSYLANMLDPFTIEPYDELFSGRSTTSVSEMLEQGKILYVYMPIADKEIMAKVVCTFVKFEFNREVLKSPGKERPSFFLCDEFQAFFTVGAGRGDADAFERTRQSNHANIIAFQNLPALLKQAPNQEPVDNLLANCAIKLFLRNTDTRTNEYASGLFGEHVETLVGTGQSSTGAKPGNLSRSLSTSAQYGARIKKDVFPALAQPSREDSVDYAETMVHMGARGRVVHERLRWRVHPIRMES